MWVFLSLVCMVGAASVDPIYFALKHRDAHLLASECMTMSREGRTISLDELRRTHSDQDVIAHVSRTLEHLGKVEVSQAGDWLKWSPASLDASNLIVEGGKRLHPKLHGYVDMFYKPRQARKKRSNPIPRRSPPPSYDGPVFFIPQMFNTTLLLQLSQFCEGSVLSNSSTICPNNTDALVAYSVNMTCSSSPKQNVLLQFPSQSFVRSLSFGYSFYTSSMDVSQHVSPFSFCNVSIAAQYASGHTSSWSIPLSLYVSPTCTPSIFRSFYGMPDYSEQVNVSSSASFDVLYEGAYCPAAADAFFEKFGVPFRSKQVLNTLPNNASSSCSQDHLSDDETNLDLTCLVMANPWATISRFGSSVPETTNLMWFEDWVIAAANNSNISLVHSLSYGIPESELDDKTYARMEMELQKLCMRGVTILVASGDSGTSAMCSFKGRNNTFETWYPAASSYVTAVGGTCFSNAVPPRPGMSFGEILNYDRTGMVSGAGMSIRSPTPSWQKRVLSQYLSTTPLPPAAFFNISGRAFPDISLVSHVVETSLSVPADGTSASSPLLAGMLSAINQELVRRQLPTIGFFNPTLYHIFEEHGQDVFYDITVGNTAAAPHSTQAELCRSGFLAAKGYDVASGVGTPYYAKLKDAIIKLQKQKKMSAGNLK